MRIAVLTLTRDRLSYTQHCFQKLHENAGVPFDHFILDQASGDGTAQWLRDEYDPDYIACSPTNVGISRGMNTLLDWVAESADYDVIIKFDNDCELVHEGTLKTVAELCVAGNSLLSPRILGLNNPPLPTGEFEIAGETIVDIPQIGGVFLAAPSPLYDTFRYSETNPLWGVDDSQVCAWHRSQGGRCGYVKRLEAWHYESTSGQHAKYPEYFARTLAEGKAAL